MSHVKGTVIQCLSVRSEVENRSLRESRRPHEVHRIYPVTNAAPIRTWNRSLTPLHECVYDLRCNPERFVFYAHTRVSICDAVNECTGRRTVSTPLGNTNQSLYMNGGMQRVGRIFSSTSVTTPADHPHHVQHLSEFPF